MSSKLILEIESEMNATQQVANLSKDVSAQHTGLRELINLLEGMEQGAYNGVVNVKLGAVAASLAGTFSGAPSADDTITLNGVVFTAKASGATGNQFNIGANVTATALNFLTAVNASATAGVKDVIFVSQVAGVVTVIAQQAGKIGNAIIVAESCTNFAFAGAATVLAGGTQQTNVTYQFGMAPSVSYL